MLGQAEQEGHVMLDDHQRDAALQLGDQLREARDPVRAESRGRLVELVAELKRTVTLVIIEHDMPFLFGLAEEVFVIHWGQVIAHGSPASLAENPWVRRSNLGALA